jgi:superfamily II DNA/RNA helicase
MSFRDLGLSTEVVDAVEAMGYTKPTPIQEKAIPYVLMSRDVLGCAQTGTGKTASFTLPMIDILASGRAKARMPRSLILEPTRELAAQVAENFEKYGANNKLSMALLIGGSSMAEQLKRLDRGVDVLIATPGRLLDLFERGKIILADTRILVIDEADRMLDMGFIPDVERIVSKLPFPHQTLFFSATMPKEIRRLADKFLSNPKEISVAPPSSPAETVTQRLVRCAKEPQAKRAVLRTLLNQELDSIQSALIFCNRKRDVGILQRSLARHGYDAEALHGDMVQSSRMETLERFRKGQIKILVCSDVAARGLDIPEVSHVFNFDVPSHADDYIHRIGRTGRAGRSGKAFTLSTSLDSKLLSAVERLIKRPIEEMVPDSRNAPQAHDKRATTETAETPENAKTEAAKPSETESKAEAAPEPSEAAAPKQEAKDDTAKDEAPMVETAKEDAGKDEKPKAKKSARSKKPKKEEKMDNSDKTENKPRGKRAEGGKGRHGEKQPGDGNGHVSTPFGDHTPAFLLKPVPLVA